jgi:hypothetical protein
MTTLTQKQFFGMVAEIKRAGGSVRLHPHWNKTEMYNHVIHQYNVHCLPGPAQRAIETFEGCYKARYARGQKWIVTGGVRVHRIQR